MKYPDGVRGFCTTRHAFASTEEKAAEKVFARLTKEFTTGASAYIWQSDAPLLSIEESWRIGLSQLFAAPNKGSTFYDTGGWESSYDMECRQVSGIPPAAETAE